MGTKYSTISISGFNSSPPSDDAATTAANSLKWSNHINKIGTPLKDLAESINTALVANFDVGPSSKAGAYTTVAGDHNKIIECTGTITISLGDASTMTSGYTVIVKNNGTGVVTVGRDTTGDTIDGTAADVTIRVNNSMTFIVNASANGYLVVAAKMEDDYEENVWTPVLTDGTNDATMSPVTYGSYTKIGRLVYISARVLTTSLGSVSGSLSISGLPFPSLSTANSHSSIYMGSGSGLALASAGATISGRINNSSSSISLQVWDGTSGTTSIPETEWTADGGVFLSGFYLT